MGQRQLAHMGISRRKDAPALCGVLEKPRKSYLNIVHRMHGLRLVVITALLTGRDCAIAISSRCN